MIEILHSSLREIRQTCDTLTSEKYGTLTEKQRNKVREIGEQAEYLSKVFDCLGELLSDNLQSSPYYEDKEQFLLNLSPETRTATAFIQTSIDLLRIYHRKALETLTPDQQVSLEYIEGQLTILEDTLVQIGHLLSNYRGVDSGVRS